MSLRDVLPSLASRFRPGLRLSSAVRAAFNSRGVSAVASRDRPGLWRRELIAVRAAINLWRARRLIRSSEYHRRKSNEHLKRAYRLAPNWWAR